MLGLILTPLKALGAWAGLFWVFASVGLYVLFHTLCGVWFRTQNLKKRYNAEWALVTGSSSGGRAGRGRAGAGATQPWPAVGAKRFMAYAQSLRPGGVTI